MFIIQKKFKKVKGISIYNYTAEIIYKNSRPRHKILKYSAESIYKRFKEQDFLHTA